jgi:hypothetical protein
VPVTFALEINPLEPPLVWRTFAQGAVTLSEGGTLATQTGGSYTLTTTGTELTAGRHYWEVELLSQRGCTYIGISRPNLNPKGMYCGSTNGWFTCATTGAFFPARDYNRGGCKQGDRVGMLLDLNDGSLRFFKNGVQHGAGFAAGSVTGPVVAAVQMANRDSSLRLLPNAEAPASA